MTLIYPASRLSFFLPSHTNSLLSINPGWYFIQIISAISMIRLHEIQSVSNITFTTRNLVYSGCYSFYLTEDQLIILQGYKELLIYPHPDIFSQSSKKLLSNTKTKLCKVKSIPNWKPTNPTINYTSWSNDIYIVNSSCSTLLPDHRIEFLSPYTGRKLRNRYNSGFIQSGSQEGILINGSLTSPRPIYDLGIHGENQIVSIIDTGVDFNHAFFKDTSSEFSETIKINTTMKTHRKIEKYYNFAKINDGENGHGTHCAGILTGESYLNDSGLILYSGISPKSRLIVADVGFGAKDLDGEFNQVELFNLFEKDGVSVSSNSWGFDANDETRTDTNLYDYISFLHQEMLLVFAAGNEAKRRPFFYTINSPGDSKNLLSVGGLTQTKLQEIETTNFWRIEINGCCFKSVHFSGGMNPIRLIRGTPMKKLINLTIIDLSKNKRIDEFGEKLVFLNDKHKNNLFCDTFLSFTDLNSIYKPPAAVIHIENNYSKCNGVTFPFPVFVLQDPLNESFQGQIKLNSTASIYEYLNSDDHQMKLADYSSKGPSPLGLCKPDVVVPGYAHSSSALKKSLTLNDLSVKKGTSMSTPAAAGSCSLIRQYFTDGFYPFRTKNISNSFVPSSYLLRAVLINSASPFNSDNYGPNIETGFGLPNLSSTLLEPLRIVKKTIIRANEKHKYTINLNSNNSSLRITLGYIDPPLEIGNPIPLFADLDLLVISPSGQLFIGNERPNHQTEMANTIERVIIKKEMVEIGSYTILVLSNNFFDPDIDSINYSIVINGPFDHYDFERNKENLLYDNEDKVCEFTCLNNGKCGKSGLCECDSNHSGFDCSIEYTEIHLIETNNIKFELNENKYFKVPIGVLKNRTNISISAKFNTNDKYASLLLYVSDVKYSSISDVNVAPVQISSRSLDIINLTLLPEKDQINEEYSLYLTLRIVSAYKFDVNITINTVEIPGLPYEEPLPTEIQTDTLNWNVLATHITSLYGLHKISFFLSCSMIVLCIVLALFSIAVVIQIRRRREIDKLFIRDEEEPKLTILEGDIDI